MKPPNSPGSQPLFSGSCSVSPLTSPEILVVSHWRPEGVGYLGGWNHLHLQIVSSMYIEVKFVGARISYFQWIIPWAFLSAETPTSVRLTNILGRLNPFPKNICQLQSLPQVGEENCIKYPKIPSWKLTYPTWGKGKSSSNMPYQGDMLIP